MKKIIKIGFPIICVAIIGGTFILLNKTTEKINKNRLKDDDIEISNSETSNIIVENEEEMTNIISPEDAKVQEVKNKATAIELVKKLAPPATDCYYTNEGMDKNNYLVAIRDNDTKDARIYYSVDIQSKKIDIYVK